MDKKNHYHQDMLSVEEARKKILGNFTSLGVESTPILKCLGMTLAKDIVSPINVPPLNNSAMDGYAIISLDTKNKIDADLLELEVTETALIQDPERTAEILKKFRALGGFFFGGFYIVLHSEMLF